MREYTVSDWFHLIESIKDICKAKGWDYSDHEDTDDKDTYDEDTDDEDNDTVNVINFSEIVYNFFIRLEKTEIKTTLLHYTNYINYTIIYGQQQLLQKKE